jgi:hypothetical protein
LFNSETFSKYISAILQTAITNSTHEWVLNIVMSLGASTLTPSHAVFQHYFITGATRETKLLNFTTQRRPQHQHTDGDCTAATRPTAASIDELFIGR